MTTETTQFKGTPGPWENRLSDGGWGEKHAVICTPDYPSRPGTYIADVTHGSSDPVRAANARLIAAAPDLLEALEAWLALEPLLDTAPDYDTFKSLGEDYEAIRARARVVIKKALGQS